MPRNVASQASTLTAWRATKSDLQDAAAAYAAQGWAVFPLAPRGKVPCIPRADGGRGVHDAATDPHAVRAWWKRYPDANVGLATGAVSGLVVLDVDGEVGRRTLEQLRERHGLAVTPTARTGGGGLHLYFAHPGHRVGNSVRRLPGLDLRGDGGYVVAPPSIHATGNPYVWELDPSSAQPAPVPAWLLELTARPPGALAPEKNGDSCAWEIRRGREASAWAGAALRDECGAVACTPVGRSGLAGAGRNDRLNTAAFNLGQLVPDHLARESVEEGLFAASEACGLVADDGEAAVRATIRSGIEAGARIGRGPRRAAGLGARQEPGPQGEPLEVATDNPPNATDMGNAERLATRHARELRYCHPWRSWVIWDGRRWARDRTGEAVRRAKETVRSLYGEAAALGEEAARRDLAKHALRSEEQRRIAGMMELARSDERISLLPEILDADGTHYLLNVLNGTLDLRTGVLSLHQPGHYITKLAPVRYDPAVTCSAWEGFLARVVPDPEVRAFLQRFAGYALTGDTSEQAFCLLYGTGANGKSTFLETLKALLGDYAHKADFETFLEARAARDRKGVPRVDLLELAGRRVVIAIETTEGRQLDATTVKELTGGDTLTARGLYHAELTSFRPQAKLFLAANHRPEIRDATEAIWRRVFEVPFTVTIPEAERDPGLPERLRQPGEQAGILNWLLEGCLAWQAASSPPRLRPPQEVRRATHAYREDQDVIGPFLAARCVREPSARATGKILRTAYVAWCQESEEQELGEKVFSRALEEHGFRRERGRDRNRTRGWVGIRLLDLTDPSGADSSDGCAGFPP